MSFKEHPPHYVHIPVLLDKTLELLAPQPNDRYLDLTAGYGGHAREVLKQAGSYTDSVLVDRDEMAIETLSDLADKGVRILHTDFVSAAKQLVEEGEQFDCILVDLGVSSPQLDRAERGFSFQRSGPLDMRMDTRHSRTAAEIANRASGSEIIRILEEYGEERQGSARRIAKAIIAARPLRTTEDLAQAVLSTHRGKWQRVHPATRTFQAFRIAVNDELRQVDELLPLLPQLLKSGGRVGIISFHSLEDRFVKKYLAEQDRSGYEAELKLVTKQPVKGSEHDVHYPRSRSAILRVAVKI